MAAAWQTETATHTEKLVLLALADNANDSGECWPSISTIAKKCSLSRQGVLNQIGRLEASKLVKSARVNGRVNRYTVTIKPVNAVDQSTPLTSQRGGLLPVNAVDCYQSTPLTGPVNAVDPNHQEPSFEPSEEPPLVLIPEEEGKKTKPWEPDLYQKKINSWFGRRDRTPWTEEELKAYRKIDEQTIKDGIEDLNAYYSASSKLAPYKRKTPLVLLRHWVEDMDKWADWTPGQDKPKDPEGKL
jgi:DNA-binding MarR family transcriptional regulator